MGMALAQFSTAAVWAEAERALTTGAGIWGTAIQSSTAIAQNAAGTILATTGDVATAGVYECRWGFGVQGGGGAETIIVEHVDNANALVRELERIQSASGSTERAGGSALVTLTAGQEVRIRVNSHTGGNSTWAYLTAARRVGAS